MTDGQTVSPSSSTPDSGGNRLKRVLLSPIAAVILALLIILGSAGAAFAVRGGDPGSGSVEAGFLRDMVTHHNQAVEMALIVYRRTADPEIVVQSYDIATTQQSQVGMMMATLSEWDLSQTGSDAAMTWMGHPTTGLMPGMATADQIGQLQTLPPEQADILFLQLMIVHHRAGVDMANDLLDRSDNDEARQFASAFARSQEVEIANMNDMLVARGQPPVDGSAFPSMGCMSGMDMTPAATPGHEGHGG